jgi:hypothetical protein
MTQNRQLITKRKIMDGKNEYLLLFRGKEWWNGLSPEELRNTIEQIKDWFNQLTESGRLKAAQPLAREGAVVSGKNGTIVADGPFAESKEVIGGYVLLQANSIDEAISVARSCPTLKFGMQAEVRPVADECPMMAYVWQIISEQQLVAA